MDTGAQALQELATYDYVAQEYMRLRDLMGDRTAGRAKKEKAFGAFFILVTSMPPAEFKRFETTWGAFCDEFRMRMRYEV